MSAPQLSRPHQQLGKQQRRAAACSIAPCTRAPAAPLAAALGGMAQRQQARALRAGRGGTVSAERAAPLAARAAPGGAALATAAEGRVPLPRTPVEMITQASDAIQRALAAGRERQRLQLLLPVNEKEFDFLATESVDYPCSLQKEFDTAVALVKGVVGAVRPNAPLQVKRIDDGDMESEPCAVVFTEAKDFVAVVYPTAERLKQIRQFAETAGRPLLIVNAQWNDGPGQVISDFGIGPFKKAADDFLATFEPSYALTEQRVGAPGSVNMASGTRFVSGGVVRSLKAYPQGYQVFAMAADGSSQLLTEFESRPSYRQLEGVLAQGRAEGLQIFKLAQQVTDVYARPNEASAAAAAAAIDYSGVAPPPEEGVVDALSADVIDALDGATLRRQLQARGLPTSGKLSALRARLKEAVC